MQVDECLPFSKIAENCLDTIPDIETTDRKYNFTDGVGQISSTLNKVVRKSFTVFVNECFQVEDGK